MFSDVVAAIDGSPESIRAAALGAQIAGAEGTTIALVAVMPKRSELKTRLGLEVEDEEIHRAQYEAMVRSAQAMLERMAPVRSAEILVGASIADAILERCDQCRGGRRLICVGSGRHRLRLGSVSSAVVRNADCPVLVVREGTARGPHLERVLLAWDGSEGARRALDAAAVLSRRTGASLLVVQVLPPSFPLPPAGLPLEPSEIDALAGEPEKREMAEAVERIEAAGGKVAGTLFDLGKPGDRLLALADRHDVDLIVVGARGRHQTLRRVLGGVSDQVVSRSARPVLVIKE